MDIRFTFGCFIILALLGCDVTDPPETIRYDFATTELGDPRTTNVTDTARAEGVESGIYIEGTIRVPTPCHDDLEAEGGRRGDEIAVAISAKQTEGGCEEQQAAIDYEATASEVASGKWEITIRHGNGTEQRTVAVDTITVTALPGS